MYRVLCDTNILLDAVVAARPEHDAALELLDRCNGLGDFGMAAAPSFKDAYYILNRQYGEATARRAVRKLMGLLAIAPVSAEECEEALGSDEPDFEDGLIRACAELNDADFIITRDVSAFKTSLVKSVTATEYLRIARARDEALKRSRMGK